MIPARSRTAQQVMEQTLTPLSRLCRLALHLGSLAAASVIFDLPAHAPPIQYQYGGVITQADPSTGIVPGTRFSGTFSYDPTGTLSGGIGFEGFSQATYGHSLNYPGSVADGSGLTLQIGGQTILANPGGVSVGLSEIDYPGQWGYRDANGPANPYTTVTISNENVDGGSLEVALGLTNPTRSLGNSFYPLTLAEFPDAQLGVTLLTNPGSETLYTGTIDSLVEMAVPEPAFTTLLCLVAIGWFTTRSRACRKVEGGPASHSQSELTR